jgi:hypothetical protein
VALPVAGEKILTGAGWALSPQAERTPHVAGSDGAGTPLECPRGRMDWRELDFVLLSPDCERTPSPERTGWETVVFELEDDEEWTDYFFSAS